MVLVYEELSGSEQAVWNAIEAGVLVALPLGGPTDDDPVGGAAWGEDRQVRAQLLYELLTGINGPKKARPRALRLAGARITGTLDLEAATIACPLSLHRCFFDQPINLREAQAPVLRLSGCRAPGLDAKQLQTQGDLELNEFAADSAVSLLGAHIGGQLSFYSATLANPGGVALFATGLTVDQGMACTERLVKGERKAFTARGRLNLRGAKISGGLDFSGAQVDGEIILDGAHVTELLFFGATLANPDGPALTADRLTVDQGMVCAQGFTAKGEVRLLGAHIGGRLSFRDATLSNPDGLALDLERLRADTLLLLPKAPPQGTVRFTNAQLHSYSDSQATWPPDLRLSGFTYGSLHAKPEVDVTARLSWLEHDPGGYIPQLYEQLAASYRKAGRDDAARKVAIAKQRRRRQTLNWPGRWWNTLLRWTVGYGYQTWKAGLWLLGLVGLGWMIFDRAHPAHLTTAKPPGQRPWFHAGLYALDLLLPFVDLGYQSTWTANEWARWVYLGWNLAGWVLITAVVAALTGLIKKE